MREWGKEFSPSYTNSPSWSSTAGKGENESKGVFAQGTYALTDNLKASSASARTGTSAVRRT